ncbi:nuclear exosome regulator NRDE2 [Phlebotomus argentipes]|uniref:nuclear exosome regulator NRDE2 n=1 Tax=Phlebotomus argentipes TaxID=94469 RepID=UPI002892C278|nr:nuclear exosome regulator NRDE2 [Phlebotomus argentipes]
MSLFPAYSQPPADENSSKDEGGNEWLSNASFVPLCLPGKSPENSSSPVPSTSADTRADAEVFQDSLEVPKRRSKKKKSKKKREEPNLTLEFTGQENYYVDKKSEIGYLKIDKLYNPACPRYYTSRVVLGKAPRSENVKYRRYFTRKPKKSDQVPDKEGKYQLSEEEFLEKNKELNAKVRQEPYNIANWVEFVEFQSLTLVKSSTTKVNIAERKMGILDKALTLNPANEELYAVYVDTITAVFPSFEVSKILDRLLAKDPVSFTLWNAQILATQGSMARCVVPDVLKLYDTCMSTMYRKLRNDSTMLKLFTRCAFFLRQAGLLEQFFALVKLALELNVSPDKFTGIDPQEADQHSLVEFEEVVLSSGLPMNEIWLRIEKLRTSFNFLPCPVGMSCTDPQRSVFNEDVCHFIYPLVDHTRSLELIFIILRLLKVPLPHHRAFWDDEGSPADLDAPEEMLNFLLCWNFAREDTITESAVSLIRELAVGPSFMTSWIGSEIYAKVVAEMLLKLAECHSGRQRSVFVLLWMRFQRLLVTIDRLEGKLVESRVKMYRKMIKSELKKEENRQEVNLFTEYALIELQLAGRALAENVFMGATANSEGALNADRFFAGVCFCEMLLKEGDQEKALIALGNLVMQKGSLDAPQKLLLVKKLRDLLTNLAQVELQCEEMEKEQFILPDYLENLIKANVYALFLVKTSEEALALIHSLRRRFCEKNARHSFLRETLFEVEAKLDTLRGHSGRFESVSAALKHFPANIFLHKCLISVHSTPWYRLKSALVKCDTPQAILSLVVAARTRHAAQEDEIMRRSQQLRVLTALRAITGDGKLRKCPLMWRLHLRSAYELEATLHQCRNVLFSALDECPWSKSLYLDGGVYVPHELTQLQDLIIEKQLRIYALPEELEILRSDGN